MGYVENNIIIKTNLKSEKETLIAAKRDMLLQPEFSKLTSYLLLIYICKFICHSSPESNIESWYSFVPNVRFFPISFKILSFFSNFSRIHKVILLSLFTFILLDSFK